MKNNNFFTSDYTLKYTLLHLAFLQGREVLKKSSKLALKACFKRFFRYFCAPIPLKRRRGSSVGKSAGFIILGVVFPPLLPPLLLTCFKGYIPYTVCNLLQKPAFSCTL